MDKARDLTTINFNNKEDMFYNIDFVKTCMVKIPFFMQKKESAELTKSN